VDDWEAEMDQRWAKRSSWGGSASEGASGGGGGGGGGGDAIAMDEHTAGQQGAAAAGAEAQAAESEADTDKVDDAAHVRVPRPRKSQEILCNVHVAALALPQLRSLDAHTSAGCNWLSHSLLHSLHVSVRVRAALPAGCGRTCICVPRKPFHKSPSCPHLVSRTGR